MIAERQFRRNYAGLIKPYERRLTAVHEAGHAVAAMVLRLRFKYVTIAPTDDANGHVSTEGLSEKNMWLTRSWGDMPNQSYYRRWSKMIFAGPVVEHAFLVALAREAGWPTSNLHELNLAGEGGDDSDFGQLRLVQSNPLIWRLRHDGEAWRWPYKPGRGPYERWAQKFIGCEKVWSAIDAVAGALLERETIKYRAARDIVRPFGVLPDKAKPTIAIERNGYAH